MAILITPDGVVQQAEPSRCIGCRSCVYACPFGVPKFDTEAKLMKKCNLCYDRTVQDLQPWCAQACPTDALWYGTYEVAAQRDGKALRETVFGTQTVRTRPVRGAAGSPADRRERASRRGWRRGPAGAVDPVMPSWRRQFPYRLEADEAVARREFLRYVIASSGALFLGSVVLAVLAPFRRKLVRRSASHAAARSLSATLAISITRGRLTRRC